jgi:hypothetical protein
MISKQSLEDMVSIISEKPIDLFSIIKTELLEDTFFISRQNVIQDVVSVMCGKLLEIYNHHRAKLLETAVSTIFA